MANQTFDLSVWQRYKKKVKAKTKTEIKDKDVQKFLRAYADNSEPAFEDRLRALDNLLKAAKALLGDKGFAQAFDESGDAGAALYSHLANIKSEVPLEKKRVEKAQRAYERKAAAEGRSEIDITVNINGYSGGKMTDFATDLVLKHAKMNPIRLKRSKATGGVTWEGIEVPRTGRLSVDLTAQRFGALLAPSKTLNIPLRGQSQLAINAQQRALKGKFRARSFEELMQNDALKATAEAEVKILKIGAEAATSKARKQQFEEQVEWEVEYGSLELKLDFN